MSTEISVGVKEISPFRVLPGAGRAEMVSLEVSCGFDPEEPKTLLQICVDEHSAFGEVIEDTFENKLKIKKIKRWSLPGDRDYEIGEEVILLDTIFSLQGTYAQLDPNNKRHLDRLATICLD